MDGHRGQPKKFRAKGVHALKKVESLWIIQYKLILSRFVRFLTLFFFNFTPRHGRLRHKNCTASKHRYFQKQDLSQFIYKVNILNGKPPIYLSVSFQEKENLCFIFSGKTLVQYFNFLYIFFFLLFINYSLSLSLFYNEGNRGGKKEPKK